MGRLFQLGVKHDNESINSFYAAILNHKEH